MTDSRNEIENVAVRLFKYWPVVVVAALAGAVALGGYAYLTAPEPGFSGTASVRVVNISGNPAAPAPETAAAAAVAASTREAALAQLGEDAKGAGAISSQVDIKDKSVVNISAVHADKEAAVRYAAAVRSIATSQALSTLSQWTDTEKARLASYQAEVARLDGQITKAEAALAKQPDDGAMTAALAALRTQRFALSEATRDITLRIATYDDTVTDFGEPSASGVSNRRTILVAAAQGALVGLLVGLVFAVVADFLRSRKERAAA